MTFSSSTRMLQLCAAHVRVCEHPSDSRQLILHHTVMYIRVCVQHVHIQHPSNSRQLMLHHNVMYIRVCVQHVHIQHPSNSRQLILHHSVMHVSTVPCWRTYVKWRICTKLAQNVVSMTRLPSVISWWFREGWDQELIIPKFPSEIWHWWDWANVHASCL